MEKFELTETLADAILFFMEDQEQDMLLDTHTLQIVPWDGIDEERAEDQEGDRYIDLPAWDSADGFALMERFASSCRSPLAREALSAALNRGRGVFRAFKDVLGHYPELEKRWFKFKELAIQRELVAWYNALRDEWGMERIGMEPEDTADLVLEDFTFREPIPADIFQIHALWRACRTDCYAAGDAPVPAPLETGTPCLMAETSAGDFAGYIGSLQKDDEICISALEIKPEYRGLGLAEALFNRLLETLKQNSEDEITMDLPAETDGFSSVLAREGFVKRSTRWSLVREAKQ
jgi:ribosomal protein S18 acetylase RimI-like enzyme